MFFFVLSCIFPSCPFFYHVSFFFFFFFFGHLNFQLESIYLQCICSSSRGQHHIIGPGRLNSTRFNVKGVSLMWKSLWTRAQTHKILCLFNVFFFLTHCHFVVLIFERRCNFSFLPALSPKTG